VSTLWLVSTPIGNLGDLAPRAVEVLATAELVCCEDTRRTSILLRHAGIRAQRLAVANEHTEDVVAGDVVRVLDAGGDVAVVSDAGTPGISDPGTRIVRAALAAGHRTSAVPGPSAALMALTISGLRTDRFVFEGFLPRRGADRDRRLADIAAERRTTVVYEAPHRVVRTMADLRAMCGDDRAVVVARELTKLHEEIQHGTFASIEIDEPRGEYVIVIAGTTRPDDPATDDDVRAALTADLAGGSSTRDAVAAVAARLGRPKREVYAIAVRLDQAVVSP
jgi:16S rRNA (cytidine1402-2'-O)-methyltransferase